MNELEFTSATLGEFEPKDEMFGSDVDTPDEMEGDANPSPTRSSSSDEIDLFKKHLDNEIEKPEKPKVKRRRLTKKATKVTQPVSDSSDEEIPTQSSRVKKLSLNEVEKAFEEENDESEASSSQGGDAESSQVEQGSVTNPEGEPESSHIPKGNESDSSEDDMQIRRKPKSKKILDSDSD